MVDYESIVCRFLQIELDRIGAELDCGNEGSESVFRCTEVEPSVSDDVRQSMRRA